MGSSPNWPAGLTEQLPPGLVERLGPLTAVAPIASGAWRARSEVGDVVVKRGAAVSDEAAGLERLGRAGSGLRVPTVLYCESDVLVLEWLETGPQSPAQEEALGAGLAALHSVGFGTWGGGSGWIGDCRVDPDPCGDAAGFYGRRLAELARRCGLEGPVGPVVERLGTLILDGPPALLHGDLWWGNVLWGSDGRPAIIDPSVHGGHPEEDLAMLALFGRVPGRVLSAYRAVRELDDGWEARTAFWQLYPLLVHAVLFGGSYRSRAQAVAARFSGRR